MKENFFSKFGKAKKTDTSETSEPKEEASYEFPKEESKATPTKGKRDMSDDEIHDLIFKKK